MSESISEVEKLILTWITILGPKKAISLVNATWNIYVLNLSKPAKVMATSVRINPANMESILITTKGKSDFEHQERSLNSFWLDFRKKQKS